MELAAHFSRWSSGIPTFIDGFKGFHEATHVMESCGPVMRVAQRAPPRALAHLPLKVAPISKAATGFTRKVWL